MAPNPNALTEAEQVAGWPPVTPDNWCGEFMRVEAPALPLLLELAPDGATVGGADVVMEVIGENFTPSSVIVWNGGDEPTTFISPTVVSTIVKPSTASGPITLPVAVRNGADVSNELMFTFV
jgi:hypothetical protein